LIAVTLFPQKRLESIPELAFLHVDIASPLLEIVIDDVFDQIPFSVELGFFDCRFGSHQQHL